MNFLVSLNLNISLDTLMSYMDAKLRIQSLRLLIGYLRKTMTLDFSCWHKAARGRSNCEQENMEGHGHWTITIR